MKKVLAFVLVLAMVLGSVSMAFAATTTYADQAEIANTEAVGVLSALKVLEGDANGFRPKDVLTRAEAAAIIARLVLGRADADKLTASAAIFTDVPANHWAAGYIAYCVSQGIIAGNGDGTFSPDGVLTVAAFGKMLLCALGYDAQTEGLVGSNWESNTAALMVKANIAVTASGPCTRDTAALLGLKTLEADVVEYSSKGVTVNTGAAQVTVGGSSASKVASQGGIDYITPAGGSSAGTQQLLEKVYEGKLKKDTTGKDDFGRPGNKWSFTGSINNAYVGEIGSFGKSAVATFTAKMSNAEINSALGGYQLSYWDAGAATTKYLTVNNTTKISQGGIAGATTFGAIVTQNYNVASAPLGVSTTAITLAQYIADLTKDGKLVEVYASNGVINNIAIVEYTLDQISSVSTGNTKTSYSLKSGGTYSVYNDGNTDNTAVVAGTVAKNDWVTYALLNGKAYIYPTTKVTGNQTSKSNGSSHSTINVDGTEYTVAKGVVNVADPTNTGFANGDDLTINIDQYGFAVRSSGASSSNYAYVAAVTTKSSATLDGSSGSAQLRVVFEDGTVGDYDLATKTSSGATYIKTYAGGTVLATAAATEFAHKVVTYTVNGSTITVEKVAEVTTAGITDGKYYAGTVATGAAIDAGQTTFDAIVSGGSNVVVMNSDSKFVVFNSEKKTASVYSGATNVPKVTAAKLATATTFYAIYKAGSVDNVKVIFLDMPTSATSKNEAFAYVDTATETQSKNGDDVVYSYTAYDQSGEKITVTADQQVNNTNFAGFATYQLVNIDANNVVTEAKTTNAVATDSAIVSDEVLVANGNYYTITDSTVTVLVKSGTSKVDGNGVVFVTGDKTDTASQVVVIYVVKNNED